MSESEEIPGQLELPLVKPAPQEDLAAYRRKVVTAQLEMLAADLDHIRRLRGEG